MELPPMPDRYGNPEDFHVRIDVVLPDGTVETITRKTMEPDNLTMLRRILRGAAAELDQRIAGTT